MSAALSSARRRRAGPDAVAPGPGVRQTTPQPSFPGTPQQQQLQQSQNMGAGLTLPQVIALIDKRLTTLETFTETQEQPSTVSVSDSDIDARINPVVEEYNTRFDIIADELASLKDTLMKLQTYTMEVNKTLMEERIRILSSEPSPFEKAMDLMNN